MSRLEMNDAFAATVAAVAPVILLVAVVEINNHRKHVGRVYEGLERRMAAAASLYAAGAQPTREQVLAADDALPEYSVLSWRDLSILVYVVSAMLACAALVYAEVSALHWLGTPKAGPDPRLAEHCFAAVVFGFVWICLSPALAMYPMLLKPRWLSPATIPKMSRFDRDVRRYRQEVADEAENARRADE
ncbi:hypothetical protein [Streptomyces sp. NPDC058653]|uniref:hypothetical protein n=1 Tax=Streptomyces sp. NPDC058653 TaxID=3346576 RepID=UPI00364A3F78